MARVRAARASPLAAAACLAGRIARAWRCFFLTVRSWVVKPPTGEVFGLMSRSFGPRLPIGLVVLAALWLITAPGAWAQKPADGVSGFAVELVYQVPDVEHPSVITCDEAGNLFVGEDPIDMAAARRPKSSIGSC